MSILSWKRAVTVIDVKLISIFLVILIPINGIQIHVPVAVGIKRHNSASAQLYIVDARLVGDIIEIAAAVVKIQVVALIGTAVKYVIIAIIVNIHENDTMTSGVSELVGNTALICLLKVSFSGHADV